MTATAPPSVRDDDQPPPTTIPADDGVSHATRAKRIRWIGFILVLAIVVAGMAQVLGVRTATTTATSADGIELSVTYGRITRPGLATTWTLTVTDPDGFDRQITLVTTASYLGMFDENGLTPDPVEISADGETISMTFDPPEGTTLEVSFDARIEPGVQWGRNGTTTLEIAGEELASVSYYTWILP